MKLLLPLESLINWLKLKSNSVPLVRQCLEEYYLIFLLWLGYGVYGKTVEQVHQL